MAKPFLKWVGGKGKLLPRYRSLLPELRRDEIYVEPFLGGGAVFFELTPFRAVLGDSNGALVNAYARVRSDIDRLLRLLRELETCHYRDDRTYASVRDAFNEFHAPPTVQAARFIYLNKTCYNGLWRVNRAGKFNVPPGHYAKPKICDEGTLRWAHEVLNRGGVEVREVDFRALLGYATPKHFYYVDPPYAPTSPTANFTAYTPGGFVEADQRALAERLRRVDHLGARFMLSNSDVPLIHELYEGFNIAKVQASRAVNSKASKRGPVTELVIRNYTT